MICGMRSGPDADREEGGAGKLEERRKRKGDGMGCGIRVCLMGSCFSRSKVDSSISRPDLIYSVFKQPCSARVIQQGTFHSPNDGQAYVLFQTQAAADQAVRRIDEGCLMLPGGRDHQLSNGEIIVADISKFEMEGSYGRIISIEMFEHMKNYKELLKKISSWMNQDSLLFVHHFCHKAFAYHFEDINEDDWITIYFFSGGTMPSVNLYLYLYFQEDLPSSSSRLKAHFVGMGYSATLADKVIKEHGQRDENLILEALFGYTHARRCCCLIE